MIKRARTALLILIFGLLVGTTAVGTACWSRQPQQPTPSVDAATDAVIPPRQLSPQAGVTPPKEQPRDDLAPRGVLRLPGPEPLALDPAVAQDVSSWLYLLQLFSGLVRLDDNLQVVPDIALDWRTDSTGTVYTFNLRRDGKFHDGKPVTAVDFKYSFERATDPALQSSAAALYLGDIVGVTDKLAGNAIDVSGVQIRGDFVLELTIDAAKPYFLSKLTYPTAFVVDRENVSNGERWWEQPNGSGPFKLGELSHEAGEMTLLFNEHYYGPKPRLAEVSFFFGAGSSMAMYERNELDVAEVGAADFERVTDQDSPLHKELVTRPQLNVWYIGLNTRVKPFEDRAVRRAFAMATDKQRLADVLLRKSRLKANGIMPPGLPGYTEHLDGIDFDPEKAKETLAQSSYGGVQNLPPITLTSSGGGLGQTFAEMYRRNLGVTINVEQADRGFFDDLGSSKYQMFYLGWVGDYPDPQDFLDILFYGTSTGNHTGYANREVDRLLEQARVEQDQLTRWQLYQRAEQEIVDDAPVIPLFHDVDHVLVKPWVKNLTWTAVGLLSLRDVTVEARPTKPGTL